VPDFLLELRSEEIPARMQAGARAELEKLLRRELDAAGIAATDITVWSTPRRLALIARGLPLATEAVSEEAKGPPEGAPDQAIDGFCRKQGVNRDQLELRDIKGRNTWFAVIEKPGRATADLLAQAIPAIVRDFSWPKSMRWGAASIGTESLRWVRPLSGVVALLGDEVVECEVHGVTSGAVTLGHRFHHSGDITIGNAGDYAMKLRAGHVIVDHEERAALIRKGAAQVAAEAGLTLVEDEGLVVENAGLTEWPVPLLGRFEEDFLSVPPEVIQLTARVNQKYFVCTAAPAQTGASGGGAPPTEVPAAAGSQLLANAFICTANIAAEDGGARVVDGNRKVLAARLSDARFFWDVDRKKTLAQHAEGLERITFHEKLGTVADKVERVAKLARWLVDEGIVTPDLQPRHPRAGGDPASSSSAAPETSGTPAFAGVTREELADLAEQAARLAKADLVTEMVGEFPELQGLMGGYYARAEGLPDAVADAIRDHYKPVGQGDEVPTAPVTVAVSLADKLDTLFAFFSIGELPTGSKDPFALRRQVLAILSLEVRNELRFSIERVCDAIGVIFHEQFVQAMAVDIPGLEEKLEAYLNSSPPKNRQCYEKLDLIYQDAKDDFLSSLADGPAAAGDPELQDPMTRWNQERRLGAMFRTYASWHKWFAEWNEIKQVEPLLLDFFADRLKVQQREAGVRHDLIDAVFALGGEDDLVRLLARVKALQNYVETAEGANLLAAYKRAANILKKEDWSSSPLPAGEGPGVGGPTPEASNTHPQPLPSREGASEEIAETGEEDPLALVDDPDMKTVNDAILAARNADHSPKTLSYTPEAAEKDLIEALAAAEPAAASAIAAEDFEGAMAALASLRAPIDRFFEEVTVNDEDREKRASRLDLLARFRAAVHTVADFARVEG
jgi:glycyl-tRNA synthetase beta chain